MNGLVRILADVGTGTVLAALIAPGLNEVCGNVGDQRERMAVVETSLAALREDVARFEVDVRAMGQVLSTIGQTQPVDYGCARNEPKIFLGPPLNGSGPTCPVCRRAWNGGMQKRRVGSRRRGRGRRIGGRQPT